MRFVIPVLFLISLTNAFGELGERDQRILDVLANREKKIENNSESSNKNQPDELQLKVNFQRRAGNFLLFYDYAGTPIYVRFMEHKWDYENEPRSKLFQRGVSYLLTIKSPQRISSPPEVYARVGEEFKNSVENFKNERSIRSGGKAVIAEMVRHLPAVLDELRY